MVYRMAKESPDSRIATQRGRFTVTEAAVTSMNRRLAMLAVLSFLVASAGCLGGATGPLHPPGGPGDERVGTSAPDRDGFPGQESPSTTEETPQAVQIPDFDFSEGSSGNVVVELTLQNTANETRTVQLVAAVEINGTLEETATQVTLEPGETRTVDVPFEGDWDDFSPNLAYARIRPGERNAGT